jgi:Tol biopolymer transport system component
MWQPRIRLITVPCFLFLIFITVAACSSPPIITETQQPAGQEPPEFEVGPISLEPSVITVGDTVTLTTTVKNIGDIAGTYTAPLINDGQQINSKDLTLIPQESSTVEFVIADLTAGKHTISIGQSLISIDVLPKPEKIAFSSYYGNYYDWEICIMDADGTNIERLTKNASIEVHPTWSPDGTKIAFQSNREWHNLSSIYVMDVDGNNVKCLTPEVKICRFPAWSPDGSKIAYCIMKVLSGGEPGMRGGEIIGYDDIFIMNPDGSGKTEVAHGWCPSWFPDSRQIAFTSNYSGTWEIYSKNIYGTDVKKLVSIPRARTNFGLPLPFSEYPVLAVSPDGNSIAFEYYDYTTGGAQDIYILNIDTGEVKNLTSQQDGVKYCPTWSPDGTKIAFTLDKGYGAGIVYAINTDGSGITRLVDGYCPSWHR